MLKRLLNECRFKLDIITQGPILIKSGVAMVSGPDMCFVQTSRNNRFEPYLPGSSLKGVFRSQGERVVNTIKDKEACMPFEETGDYKFCGKKIENEDNLTKGKIYKMSCPICKLFGSTSYVGRISISDAYVKNGQHKDKKKKPEFHKERRDGVGIDRFTGGTAGGAKFDLEPVINTTFEATVYVRNFEIWQIGLLCCLLRDLKDGYIYIGSGKSRGLGKVTAKWNDFNITLPGRPKILDNIVPGVGYLIKETPNAYGYSKGDYIEMKDTGIEKTQEGIRTHIRFDDKAFKSLMDKSINIFFNHIQSLGGPV